jgi:hypothetical protein
VPDATCKACPFFDAAPDAAWGQCRKTPPVYDPQSGSSEWPRTDDNAWCGEHPALRRDQIAAMAMPGLLADESGGEGGFFRDLGVMAKRAYDVADAMLAERARREAIPSPAVEVAP